MPFFMGGDFLVNPKIYFEHMARVMYEYFIYWEYQQTCLVYQINRK